jgi:hypothetical protein
MHALTRKEDYLGKNISSLQPTIRKTALVVICIFQKGNNIELTN